MSFSTMHLLVLAQMGVDIIIIALFITFLKKSMSFSKGKSPNEIVRVFNSFLTDADNVAIHLEEQLKEKRHLMNRLNKELDKRIMNLNLMLNRADTLLSLDNQKSVAGTSKKPSLADKYAEVISLAKKGRRAEEIADALSLPMGEVKLVLDLKMAAAGRGSKEGNA